MKDKEPNLFDLFKAIDKHLAKDKIKNILEVPPHIDDLATINETLRTNPQYFVFYNSIYQKIKQRSVEESEKLNDIYAKLFCGYKEELINNKTPSDSWVEQKINNNKEHQVQKKICNRIKYYEEYIKSILIGLNGQIGILQTISSNLRSERK
jgi:transketolase